MFEDNFTKQKEEQASKKRKYVINNIPNDQEECTCHYSINGIACGNVNCSVYNNKQIKGV